MRTTVALVVALGVSITAVACGGSPSGPSQFGTLRVMITDSPYGEASAVHVTFKELQIHPADGEWMPVDFAPATASRTCNLKKLEGPIDVLGADSLTVGRYTQVRLVVSEAVIYFGGTKTAEPACAATLAPPAGFASNAPLEIPSGEVKLNREFELVADGTTTIELDFDGDKSITLTGSNRYRMTPVIGIKGVSTPQ